MLWLAATFHAILWRHVRSGEDAGSGVRHGPARHLARPLGRQGAKLRLQEGADAGRARDLLPTVPWRAGPILGRCVRGSPGAPRGGRCVAARRPVGVAAAAGRRLRRSGPATARLPVRRDDRPHRGPCTGSGGRSPSRPAATDPGASSPGQAGANPDESGAVAPCGSRPAARALRARSRHGVRRRTRYPRGRTCPSRGSAGQHQPARWRAGRHAAACDHPRAVQPASAQRYRHRGPASGRNDRPRRARGRARRYRWPHGRAARRRHLQAADPACRGRNGRRHAASPAVP